MTSSKQQSILPQLTSIADFLFNKSTDLIALLDEQFEYIWINEAPHVRILGYNRDDLVGTSIFDFYHPKDKKYSIEELRKLYNKDIKVQARLRHKNGTYKWFDIIGFEFVSSNGKSQEICVFKDITLAKENQEKLILSELKYHTLFEETPFIIVIFNKEGVIVDFNRQVELYGFDTTDLLGRALTELTDVIPEQYLSLILTSFHKMVTEGQTNPIEIQLYNKEKDLIWVHVQSMIINVEAERFIQVIIQDINDRKIAEQKLKESEKKYRNIVESVIESYFELDRFGNFTYVNNVLCQNLGYSHREDVLNKNFREFFDEKNTAYFYKKFTELWKNEEIHMHFEGTWIRQDGQKIAFKGIAGLRYNSQGEKEGFYGIARNI